MNTPLFSIHTEAEFEQLCIDTFRYQYQTIPMYSQFVDYLNIIPENVNSIQKIPFLPIEMFKKHTIIAKNNSATHYFQSSGTGNMAVRSRHYIHDFTLYEHSILSSFSHFIGDPSEYIILGLLPNYSENPHSSLIYMVNFLMKKSNKEENQYFLYNHEALANILSQTEQKKILLFGVSFALLDFLDYLDENSISLPENPNLTLIETGGMKGRKTEMTKDLLLDMLKNGYRTPHIFSEYSMTELLSQAYSLGNNLYHSPNWMRVLIRSIDDPFSFLPEGRTGGVNIIDLANIHSCAFIATQDIGKLRGKSQLSLHHTFEILGRIDHSDLRGCSLLVS